MEFLYGKKKQWTSKYQRMHFITRQIKKYDSGSLLNMKSVRAGYSQEAMPISSDQPITTNEKWNIYQTQACIWWTGQSQSIFYFVFPH